MDASKSHNANALLLEREAAWREATSVRRSRRGFDGMAASHELLDALARACEKFRPHEDARAELVRDPAVDVFRGAIGTYGKVTHAPHVLGVIVRDGAPHAMAHAGYTGEAAILEATARGLETCWVGGFFSRARADRVFSLAHDERVVAVSPVGHAKATLTRAERVMRAMSGAHERKALSLIAPGAEDDGWPAWALAAVACARVAPSAVNRQPWVFRMDGDELVVARDSAGELPSVHKSLDCGIAMLHAELGARSEGVPGRWVDSTDGLDVARYVPDSEEYI